MLMVLATLLALSCRYEGVPGTMDEVPQAAITAETLYRSIDCLTDRTDPHARWLDSPQQWRQFWETQHQHHVEGKPPAMPKVDFASQGVLLIHMGRQPTGGYALELADPPCRVVDETLSIYVNWTLPPVGTAVIQMITAPCMLLKLSKGNYRSIEIVDQSGGVKASVDIPTTVD
jgi:hypothetical protein